MKIAVTGAGGLLGWHAVVRLHAANCAARHRGEAEPWEIAPLDRAGFNDDARLGAALGGAGAVLHFAGINRADDTALEAGNIALAGRLAAHLTGRPAVVHANSVHADPAHAARDTAYARGKRGAAAVLAGWAGRAGATFADLVLPHLFGEGARPDYNTVTATLCDRAVRGATPEIDADGRVELVHAGAAADRAIALAAGAASGVRRMTGRAIAVPDLWEKIRGFHEGYRANRLPDLADPFDLALFNTLRQHAWPDRLPGPPALHTDARGTLFEAVRGGGGGQCFVSRTVPGAVRGDHFHLMKVERFLVLEGEAIIRVRRVLGRRVRSWRVTGTEPMPLDMPTLHAHSIENTGTGPLIALFWAHEIFDPDAPDTYADAVLRSRADPGSHP